MASNPIYLDWNASAPMHPAARAAMCEAMDDGANPSSIHRAGRQARRRVEDARQAVAMAVGAAPAEIVFTGSGTEANNLALHGSGRARIVASAIEHDSVLNAAPEAEKIPVDGDGVVDLAALDRLLAGKNAPALVSVMLANNETGVIQPVAEAARIAHRHGALIHCDAVQALGKIAVDFAALDVDYLSFSAHKIGGPQGVGALVVRDGAPLKAQIRGGGQERFRRAGTENIAGIAGFGAAAAVIGEMLAKVSRIADLRGEMETALLALAPGAKAIGAGAPRLANTLCLSVPGQRAETLVMKLDLAGIAVGAGAACSSGKVKASHVMTAMGLPAGLAEGAIRISLGWQTARQEIDALIGAWKTIMGGATSAHAA